MKRKLLVALSLVMALSSSGAMSLKAYALPNNEVIESVTSETNELVKNTKYGSVVGTTSNASNVWYSIPYASAPVGELRWKAPVDPEKWSDPLDCSNARNPAIQAGTDYATGETKITGTEDCLNLDVYAPENAKDLPVLVYIHGGNNQTGSSTEIEGSQIVVDENCVYVSLNYRLGILGFNALPAFTSGDDGTGNYAMLDIAKGLDWVRENIEQFGGNPNNITVSGFSAGGRDVMAMLISPIFKGKFDKAVVYSGGMTVADEDVSAEIIAEAVAPLAVADGIVSDEETAKTWLLSDDPAVVSYMKSIDAERLCQLMSNAGIRMSVFPHLYKDDVVIPKGGFDTTNYNSVPILMLTGETEFSLFSAFDGFFYSPAVQSLDEKTQNLAKSYAIEYGSEMYRIFNAQASAQKMYSMYKDDIYLCQLRYGSNESKTRIPLMGSFHGVFVPMLTDNHKYGGFADFNNVGYQSMASVYDKYLSNFLVSGNPNGENLTSWAKWTPANPVSLVLDADETNAIITLEDTTSSYGKVIGQMEADSSISDDAKKLMIDNVLNGRWFSTTLDEKYGN